MAYDVFEGITVDVKTDCAKYFCRNSVFSIENLKNFFSTIIIFIAQTYKTKSITITRYYFILPKPVKKGKIQKQTEIEVRIIKAKKQLFIDLELMFKFANSFHQVMSDTDKQRYFLIFTRS